MLSFYLPEIYNKIHQSKIIAYSALVVVFLYAAATITVAPAQAENNQSNSVAEKVVQPTVLVNTTTPSVPQSVSAPAKQIGLISSSDVVQATIVDQANQKQLSIVQEELVQKKIADEKRIADEKAAAEKAAEELRVKLRGQPGESYPWAASSYYSNSPDPWGMYKRQCVSYAAWKVASSGRVMPYWGGRGNASNWDNNARAAGIAVDAVPRIGDVAVDNSGYYGHVMFVEDVYQNGTILISQYNADGAGHYSTDTVAATGLLFIHF